MLHRSHWHTWEQNPPPMTWRQIEQKTSSTIWWQYLQNCKLLVWFQPFWMKLVLKIITVLKESYTFRMRGWSARSSSSSKLISLPCTRALVASICTAPHIKTSFSGQSRLRLENFWGWKSTYGLDLYDQQHCFMLLSYETCTSGIHKNEKVFMFLCPLENLCPPNPHNLFPLLVVHFSQVVHMLRDSTAAIIYWHICWLYTSYNSSELYNSNLQWLLQNSLLHKHTWCVSIQVLPDHEETQP